MNKKIIWIVVAVILVGAIIYAYNPSAPVGDKPVVKIGITLPLTGNAAFLGESAKNAAELALKELGNTKYDYKLVFEDDAFNPMNSVTAATKLVEVDKASYLINFGSGTGNAVSPIAETKKIPHFSLASDPTAAVGNYNYIHWTPPFNEGKLMAEEMIRRGYKNVSIIDTNHPGTLAVTAAVKQALEGSSVKVVSYDLTNVGDKDFRTIVSKIKRLNPDIVLLELFSPEIEMATKQMKELGLNAPVTSVEAFEWSDNLALFEGNWFVSDFRVTQDFVDQYSKEYGSNPKPGASYVYDLVMFIAKLQESSKQVINPADVPAAISALGSYKSPLFGKVVIDKAGFFLTNASVKLIQGGQVIYP